MFACDDCLEIAPDTFPIGPHFRFIRLLAA